MNPQATLQAYTNADQARKDHIAANAEVFKQHERLVMAVIDAENNLRDAVAESGQPIENGSYRVTVTPQTMRTYDEDKLRAALSSNPAILADAIKDVPRPPRITISAKERTI